MYVYLLRNTVNGKGYVGITTQQVQRRFLAHVSTSRTGKPHALARALRKYGPERFTVTLLGQANSWAELCAMERAAIQEYHTFERTGHGYNLTLGGDGTYGRLQTAEAKLIISLKKKGKKMTPEQAARHRAAVPRGAAHHRYGTTLTPEHAAKLQAGHRAYFATHPYSRLGVEVSIATRKKIAAKARGRRHSEATRQKLSAAHLGRVAWNTGLVGGPAWNAGVPSSAETKQRLSARNTGAGNPNCRPIEVDGVVYPMIQAAIAATGISRTQMYLWLKTGKARYLPKDTVNPYHRPIEIAGTVYPTLQAATAATGISQSTLRRWLKNGKARELSPARGE